MIGDLDNIEKLQKITGDDHLEKMHGIDLFDAVNGSIRPGAQMLTILQASKAELQ